MDYKNAVLSLLSDIRTLEVMEDAVKEDHNSYLEMYNRIADAVPEMLKTPMTVKLLPMVVYGWMPTILGKSVWDESIFELLNRKSGEFTEKEMKTLFGFVNDSYIGLSKLLHFTDPGHWAIWDSNVYAAIEFIAAGKPDEKIASFCLGNYARVNNKHSFEKYQQTLREVSAETGLPIREIEKRLFYVGRKLKETAKNLQNNCQK